MYVRTQADGRKRGQWLVGEISKKPHVDGPSRTPHVPAATKTWKTLQEVFTGLS